MYRQTKLSKYEELMTRRLINATVIFCCAFILLMFTKMACDHYFAIPERYNHFATGECVYVRVHGQCYDCTILDSLETTNYISKYTDGSEECVDYEY